MHLNMSHMSKRHLHGNGCKTVICDSTTEFFCKYWDLNSRPFEPVFSHCATLYSSNSSVVQTHGSAHSSCLYPGYHLEAINQLPWITFEHSLGLYSKAELHYNLQLSFDGQATTSALYANPTFNHEIGLAYYFIVGLATFRSWHVLQ